MKKWIAMVLALLMVLPLAACKKEAPATATDEPTEEEISIPEFVAEDYDQTGTCGEDAQWGYVEETGKLTIIGSGAMENYEFIPDINRTTAPWSELPIQSVSIYGVTTIGNLAFHGCYDLPSVKIPDSVTDIGSYAFFGCESLTSVEISDSVTTIGEEAFRGCNNLTSVELGNGVTTIGAAAFSDCNSLINIFADNSAYRDVDGVLFTKDMTTLVQYPAGKEQTSYTIPDSVTTIGEDAFSYCNNLTSVEFPDGLTTIENEAFALCDLTSVELPDSVTTIGDSAFTLCPLTSVEIGNSVTTIGAAAFSSCLYLTSVEIGNSVTYIGDTAFYSCINLTSVEIPDSVTTIGKGAFWCCESLTSVEIGNGVTAIGNLAFAGCSSLINIFADNSAYQDVDGVLFTKDMRTLVQYPAGKEQTSYTIPDGVTVIGAFAFSPCSNLTSVELPDSVTTIGKGAFSDCESLTDIYYGGTEEQWNSIDFGDYDHEELFAANIHYNS